MAEAMTVFLSNSPYAFENIYSVIKLVDAALDKGHTVNLIASGDGIYCFLKGQKAKGLPNAEEEFTRLIGRGLKVYL
jgi:sulfur relay (sulfurtransferase) complex TusBCD TusD component (DsrE family)